ncbi:MAG: HAD hydrolase family protein [Alphaproteobacteria bacterium]|nr:HAD hydrolase family protein [Alphaproteobacteria bacterium]
MGADVKLRQSDIDLLVFDFDGVLTDNRVIVFQDGTEAVVCNRSDGLAFDAFRRHGLKTMIMSTEKNSVVSQRARKLQVPVIQSLSNKGQAIITFCAENAIDMCRVAFVGNDLNDLQAMEKVGFAIAPGDAHPSVKAVAHITLFAKGGYGVAREIAEDILHLDIA